MLYLYEVKKTISQKLFIVSVCIMTVFCVGIWAYEILKQPYYTSNNEAQNEISAVQKLYKEKTSGFEMNDIHVQNVVKQYQSIISNPKHITASGELDMTLIGHAWQKIDNIVNLLSRAYSSSQSFDNSVLKSIDSSNIHANTILLERTEQLKLFLNFERNNKPLYTKYEKHRVQNLLDSKRLEIKSERYEDASGWSELFSHLLYIQMGILIISAIIGSRIFSREIQMHTASLLYTSKRGRTRGIVMKYLTCISIISVLTIAFNLLYTMLVFFIYGNSGMFTIIQFQSAYWLSIYPITNFEAYLYICMMGYMGSIVMLLISMFISRYTQKQHISLIVALCVLFIPIIWTSPYPIFPYHMANANLSLMTISIQQIGGVPIFDYELQLIISVLCMISIIYICHSYSNKKAFYLE